MKSKITNWGNFPVVYSEDLLFVYEEELTLKIKELDNLIPRGNGRCYGDASLSVNTVTTTSFNKIISFDKENGIIECQSGLTLDHILEIIVPCGWFLPVTPGTKFITVGGAVASDVHGKNHHVDGAFSAHVKRIDVLIENGTILSCGPGVNDDFFNATCGGMGLTGLILNVSFKLKKIQTSFINQLQIKAKNLEEVISLFDKYQHYTYSVAWIDCLQKGDNFGRSILMLGEHAKPDELPPDLKIKPLKLPKKKQIKFPFFLPSWVLNKISVKAFNMLFYNKNLKKEQRNIISYEPFFYPLDVIHDWNKGYGRQGFIQYQFVLPLTSKQGLVDILTMISEQGLGSFLAVLKIFGKQESLISFPIEGYTLALDFPVRKGLFPFLDKLDKVVLDYGGRLYMSKDARMKPEILSGGYQRLDEFKDILRKYNPNRKFSSLLSNRLKLT